MPLTVAALELEPDRLPLLVDVVLRLEAEHRRRLLERRRRRLRGVVRVRPRRLRARAALEVGANGDDLLAAGRGLLEAEL